MPINWEQNQLGDAFDQQKRQAARYQLGNMKQQTELNQLNIDSKRQEVSQAQAYRDAFAQGGSLQDVRTRLQAAGAGDMILKIDETLSKLDTEKLTQLSKELENNQKKADQLSEKAMRVLAAPPEMRPQMAQALGVPADEQGLMSLASFAQLSKFMKDAADEKRAAAGETRAQTKFDQEQKQVTVVPNSEVYRDGHKFITFKYPDQTTKEFDLGVAQAPPQASNLKTPEEEAQAIRISGANRAAEPLQAIIGPDGQSVLVPRSAAVGQRPAPSSQSRPPTEAERTSLRFYERMKGAADDLVGVEETVNKLGLGGQAWLKLAPNFLQTENGQLYQQAQRAFTEARLRKDSGAAIPETEFENDRRTYFVQPGDKPAVIEQKRKARETAMSALRKSAARAYEESYGEDPSKPAGGPKVGEVVDGYVFQGGDPANPASWKAK